MTRPHGPYHNFAVEHDRHDSWYKEDMDIGLVKEILAQTPTLSSQLNAPHEKVCNSPLNMIHIHYSFRFLLVCISNTQSGKTILTLLCSLGSSTSADHVSLFTHLCTKYNVDVNSADNVNYLFLFSSY